MTLPALKALLTIPINSTFENVIMTSMMAVSHFENA